MARLTRFSRSLASGYVLLGANILSTVISVPLALNYLTVEEFGLWAVMAQISSYLGLFDLGMSASAFRLLIDHKDREVEGAYERHYCASAIIFAFQAFLILVCAALAGPLLARALNIPEPYIADFSLLLCFSSFLLALNFCFKIFYIALQAHQRFDIINFAQSANLLISILLLWWSLESGHGVYSGVVSGAIGGTLSLIAIATGARVIGCAIPLSEWRLPDRRTVKNLLSFSSDAFLMNLGWQMVGASHVLLVTKALGLEAAGVWSVATKVLNMSQQLVWRPLDYSGPVFAEMFVRREIDLLRQRFQEIFSITLSMCVVAGAVLIACNRPLLMVWQLLSGGSSPTAVRISDWSSIDNILSAGVLFTYTFTRLLNSLPGISKQLHVLRYIYFIEGVLVLVLGWFFAQIWGYGGVLAAAIVADISVAGVYGLSFASKFFNIEFLTQLRWLTPALKVCVAIVPIAAVLIIVTSSLPVFWQLALRGVGISLGGIVLIWFASVPYSVRMNCRNYFQKIAVNL